MFRDENNDGMLKQVIVTLQCPGPLIITVEPI